MERTTEVPKIVVIGGGDHSKVVIALAKLLGHSIEGYVAPLKGQDILGVKWIGNDEILNSKEFLNFVLVNGIGSTKNCILRSEIFIRFKDLGFRFLTLVHPSSVVGEESTIGEGTVLLPGVILGVNVSIGKNVILNSGSILEHDSVVGDHTHIAPGVKFSGNVVVSEKCHIGTGAVSIQGIKVGENSLVGAGSLLIRDVLPSTRVAGVPAREI